MKGGRGEGGGREGGRERDRERERERERGQFLNLMQTAIPATDNDSNTLYVSRCGLGVVNRQYV